MGTSPSAVPAKRSAQGECRGGEEEEEEAAGSNAKRRREESHMTGEGFSKQQLVSLLCHATRSPHHGLHELCSECTYWIGSCVLRRLVW